MATMPAVELADHLRALCGPEHVTADPQLWVKGLCPRYAVSPATPEEVAAVLNAAREANAAVIPWGGGTQQNIGATPTRADLILHTRRLTGIVEWEPADLTAGILAGTTLAEVQRTLAAQGQQLAIDAPLPDRATVGGLVATNTTGSRRWRYGGWRDQIIGMHMALADGTAVKSGGRVVKNVQGYDLAKLFTGSLGTLGVVGRVNVKLHPLPQARRLIMASGTLRSVMQGVHAVTASTLRPSIADVISRWTLAGAEFNFAEDYAGLFLFEGSQVAVEAQSRDLTRLLSTDGARTSSVDDVSDSHLQRIYDIGDGWFWPDGSIIKGSGSALLTIRVPPVEVEQAIETLERECRHRAVQMWLQAHAGNGVVNAWVHEEEAPEKGVAAAVHAALLPRWPATTLFTSDPEIERATRPWGADPPGLATMRAVKHAYDPAGILNPGRYVGGI